AGARGLPIHTTCFAVREPEPDRLTSRHRERNLRLFRWWVAFGFPAFEAVLGIVWLMLRKPVV
ncbi:MAG: DUF2269 family protein, partial [Rhodobacteraceae bacterium]|nr:DUF2269 family protein [Paracoccaceae bacterium]